MSWFYLALLAPLLFAVVNIIDDTLVRKVYKGPYFTAMIAGLFGGLPLLSRFFMHASSISLPLSLIALAAGFMTPLYYYCYFKALEIESPSIVIAMFMLTPATLPFLAHYFLHESLAAAQIAGFVIVLFASMGLAVENVRKFKFSKALFPVFIGVVLLDAISLLTKHVYQLVDFYPAYLYFSGGMALSGFYFFLVMYYSSSTKALRSIKKSFIKYLWLFALGEAFGLAAEFVGNLAVSRGPVSLVKVIEGTQPVYVLLIAIIFYPFMPSYLREATQGKFTKKFALMAVAIVGLLLINRA